MATKLRKIEHDVLLQDAAGRVVVASTGIQVTVLRGGCTVVAQVSGGIGDTVREYRVGERGDVQAGDVLLAVAAGVLVDTVEFTVTSITPHSSFGWVLQVSASVTGVVHPAAGDRLIHVPTLASAKATLFRDGAGLLALSNPLVLGAAGTVDCFTEEEVVDLYIDTSTAVSVVADVRPAETGNCRRSIQTVTAGITVDLPANAPLAYVDYSSGGTLEALTIDGGEPQEGDERLLLIYTGGSTCEVVHSPSVPTPNELVVPTGANLLIQDTYYLLRLVALNISGVMVWYVLLHDMQAWDGDGLQMKALDTNDKLLKGLHYIDVGIAHTGSTGKTAIMDVVVPALSWTTGDVLRVHAHVLRANALGNLTITLEDGTTTFFNHTFSAGGNIFVIELTIHQQSTGTIRYHAYGLETGMVGVGSATASFNPLSSKTLTVYATLANGADVVTGLFMEVERHNA